MTVEVRYEAVLRYEDEELVPANPEEQIRRLVMSEPEFGTVEIEMEEQNE